MNKLIIGGAILVMFVFLGLYFGGVLQSVLPPGTYICDQNDVDLVIVSDTSNSMDDNCRCADGTFSNNGFCTETQGYPYHPDYPCNINGVKDAAKSLITGLEPNQNNYIGLVEYGTKVKSYRELGMSFPMVHVDDYDATGMTCISCGIEKAIEIINKGWDCVDGWCNNDDKIILVMSDGEANRCHAGVACTVQEAKQEAIDRATEAYTQYGIRIFSVAYEGEAEQQTLREIASVGHGEFFQAGYDNINEIYLEIGGIVTCQKCNEDGICDLGENCQRCPSDCIPGPGETCCDGNIVGVDCSVDSQCNDGDICTDDECDTQVCAGVCINTVKPGYGYDQFGVCRPPCQDGTEWGSCSLENQGYYCA